jgi:hypothetical protein
MTFQPNLVVTNYHITYQTPQQEATWRQMLALVVRWQRNEKLRTQPLPETIYPARIQNQAVAHLVLE